jgi:hypothetical protein
MGAHESMEHAEHAEHASGSNKSIALLIAVIALFLAFSETLGKGAQTESISKNVEASNLWAFFQAKSIRRTTVQAVSEHAKLSLGAATDEAQKAALAKQIDDWTKTARVIVPNRKPAKAPSSWRHAQRKPNTPAISPWRATTTTRWRPPHSRSDRAGIRDNYHRHDRAGMGVRSAGAGRPCLHGDWPVRPHAVHLM